MQQYRTYGEYSPRAPKTSPFPNAKQVPYALFLVASCLVLGYMLAIIVDTVLVMVNNGPPPGLQKADTIFSLPLPNGVFYDFVLNHTRYVDYVAVSIASDLLSGNQKAAEAGQPDPEELLQVAYVTLASMGALLVFLSAYVIQDIETKNIANALFSGAVLTSAALFFTAIVSSVDAALPSFIPLGRPIALLIVVALVHSALGQGPAMLVGIALILVSGSVKPKEEDSTRHESSTKPTDGERKQYEANRSVATFTGESTVRLDGHPLAVPIRAGDFFQAGGVTTKIASVSWTVRPTITLVTAFANWKQIPTSSYAIHPAKRVEEAILKKGAAGEPAVSTDPAVKYPPVSGSRQQTAWTILQNAKNGIPLNQGIRNADFGDISTITFTKNGTAVTQTTPRRYSGLLWGYWTEVSPEFVNPGLSKGSFDNVALSFNRNIFFSRFFGVFGDLFQAGGGISDDYF